MEAEIAEILDDEDHVARWKKIERLFPARLHEYQGLVAIETALVTQWRPPTRDERIAAFERMVDGVRLGIHSENFYDLINPVRVIQATKRVGLMYARLNDGRRELPPSHLWSKLWLSQNVVMQALSARARASISGMKTSRMCWALEQRVSS